MQARDMADLGHNMADGMASMAHAMGDALSAVGRAISAAGAAFAAGVRSALTAIGEWLSAAQLYVKGIMLASYYIFGQYLAPIQKEVFGHEPPTLEAMLRNNWVGGLLAFIPFGLPAMLFAFPMAIIYNSIQSIPRAFVNPINTVLSDSPQDQIQQPNVPWLQGEDDNRNGLRKYLFGLPGLLIGGIPGVVCATFVLVSRVLYHQIISGVHGTVWGLNLGLKEQDQIQFADTRAGLSKWGFGGLGYLLGGALGLVCGASVFFARQLWNVVANTVLTTGYTAANTMDFSLHKDHEIKPNDGRALDAKVYGCLGYLLGGAIGVIATPFILVSRFIYNTIVSAGYGFIKGLNQGLRESEQIQSNDTRDDRSRLAFGGVGLVVGGLFGLVCGASVFSARRIWDVASRLVVNTVLTTGYTAANIMDFSLHKDHELKPNDERSLDAKVYGGLGYLLGGAIGVIATPFILVSRLIYNSFVSAGYGFAKGLNQGLHESEQIQSNDTRDDRSRLAFGGVGLVVGGLFGLVCGASVFSARQLWNVVANTVLTTGYTAANIMDLSLNKDHELKPNDGRALGAKIYGGLGYLLGGAIGFMATPIILVSRLIYNSFVSAGYGFAKGLNQGLHESEQIQLNDTRDDHSRLAFGGLGFAVGGLFGLVSAASVLSVRWMWDVASQLAVNTLLTTAYTCANIMDLSLHKDHEFKLNDDRTGKAKFYGSLGYVLGGVAGLIITPVILASRFLFNSAVSVGYGFASGLNYGLHESEQIQSNDIRDDRSRLVFGGVGYALGGLLGFAGAAVIVSCRWLGRVFSNIGQSTAISFVNCLNAVLPADRENEKWQVKPTNDTRSGVGKYLSHAVGYPLGFALSLAPGLMVVTGRLIVNTLLTLGYTSAKVMNLSLHKDHEIQINDERTREQKAYGSLGYLLGGIAGLMATPFILASRFIYNSMVSGGHGFAFGLNRSLNEQDQIHTVDKRDDISRWGFGGFGYGVGLALGIVASGVVESCRLLGRMLSNIAQSTAISFVNCLNAVLPADRENEKWQVKPTNDTRSGVGKYLSHAVGYPLGFALSLVPGAVVFAGRLLMNTFKSWGYTAAQVIDQSLHKDWEIKPHDQRTANAKLYGIVGDALGVVTGAIVTPLIWVGRMLYNSVVSSYYGCSTYYDRGLGKQTDLTADTRDESSRHFGILGLGIGAVVGVFAAGCVHFVSNTFDNFIRANAFMMNQALHKDDEIKLAADNRHMAAKASGIVGAIGFATGAVCAGLIGIARVIGVISRFVMRVFENSMDTASRAMVSMINPFLHGEDKLKAKSLGQADERSLVDQYGSGLPGLVLGGACGIVAAVGIAVTRLITNTCKSFWTMTTSLLNVGLGKPAFAGWNADQRSDSQKGLGVLGYIAAVPVGMAIAASIFTLRKLPLMAFGLMGVCVSPMVAGYKASCETIPDRFPTNAPRPHGQQGEQSFESREDIEQGFKNIYSSLTGWGSLPAGSQIAEHGNGQTSTALWWKKAFTYNFRSITEKTLDAILEGYRRYQQKRPEGDSGGGYFDDLEFNTAIVGLKEDYQSGCITDNDDVAEIHAEIDHIAAFVKEYMTTRIPVAVPRDIYGARPWNASFFGAAPKPSAPPADDQPVAAYAALPGASPKPSAPPADDQPVVIHMTPAASFGM